jgi:hypothetical protein
LGALTAIAVTGSPSFAVRPVKSIFTTLDRNHCEVLAQQPSTGRLRCEGLPGYPVTIAEEALKSFVSVGTDAENRKAASQTLTAPNSLFKDGSHRATVEWRFVIRDEKPKPYAMIVRYFTKSQTRRGQVLVVTRVTDSEACHVAYIDAVANTNAIILARRIADEKARKFDCKSDPARVGAVGKSPM